MDSEGFEDVTVVGKEFVSLGESVGLKVNQNDGEDLIQSHSRELTTKDLQDWTASLKTTVGGGTRPR
jgi:hypothetical protein